MRQGETNVRRSRFVAGLAVAAIALASCSETTTRRAREIRVSGFATVSGAPDIAVLRLGVGATRSTVGEARDATAAAVSAVVSAVRSAGVEEGDVRTSHYSIRPRYEYNRFDEERFVGHEASITLDVTVRDLESAGGVVDSAVAAGGDSTRVEQVDFRVEDPGSLEREARRRAVQDATGKADLYAEELGLVRGAVVHVTDRVQGFDPTGRSRVQAFQVTAETFRPATEFFVGDVEVIAQVEVVFAIE